MMKNQTGRLFQLGDQEIEILKPMSLKSRIINPEQRLIMIKHVMGSFDKLRRRLEA